MEDLLVLGKHLFLVMGCAIPFKWNGLYLTSATGNKSEYMIAMGMVGNDRLSLKLKKKEA